jgi:hypothetical protein
MITRRIIKIIDAINPTTTSDFQNIGSFENVIGIESDL